MRLSKETRQKVVSCTISRMAPCIVSVRSEASEPRKNVTKSHVFLKAVRLNPKVHEGEKRSVYTSQSKIAQSVPLLVDKTGQKVVRCAISRMAPCIVSGAKRSVYTSQAKIVQIAAFGPVL